MATEVRTDPTARDLLRIAVDCAEQARAVGESFDGTRRRERFGSLLRVADTYGNLARAAAAVEAGEPDVRVVGEDDPADLAPCGTCGHPEVVHTETICTRCNRYGGMCERPYVVMCPGPGYCAARDHGHGHKHMSNGEVLATAEIPRVDLNALRAQLAGPTPLDRKIPTSDQPAAVRRLRPVNRGPFVDDTPTQPLPVVRREQAGPFGPPDVDATAEIPRVGNYGPGQPAARCAYRGPFHGGRQCLLAAHGHDVNHEFAPGKDDAADVAWDMLRPGTPDDIA